jgi:hypothetical protein
LDTEAPAYAVDPQPAGIAGETIEFRRPGAVLLGASG